MLPVTVAGYFSDDIAIRYVFPVLWMALCFYIMEQMGQNQWQRCFVQFVRRRHRGGSCCLRLQACFFLNFFRDSFPSDLDPKSASNLQRSCICNYGIWASTPTNPSPIRWVHLSLLNYSLIAVHWTWYFFQKM